MSSYIKLSIAALLPVILALILKILKNKTHDGGSYWVKQIVAGILFGALAIVGTEWGIPLEGAMINCRDAAPMIAGLAFGAPAGIIAGVIGGVERWIAVAWGVGAYTRVACSVSTVIAGLYSAALRKFMFEDKHPSWPMGFALGVVMEIFHLSMVFLTHMDDSARAMEIVRICSIPMVLASGISVMLGMMVVSWVEKDPDPDKRLTVSQAIQRYMLIAVIVIFAGIMYFSFSLQNQMADAQIEAMLRVSIEDLKQDISDSSDSNLVAKAYQVRDDFEKYSLDELAKLHNVAEIDVVGKDGIISDCTNTEFIGFDMASGEQSAEFLCLLGRTTEYVQPYGPISYDPSISRKYAGVKTDNGFIQVAYDAEFFQKDINEQIKLAAKNRHIGETGYDVIVDSKDYVISAPLGVGINTLASINNSLVAQGITPEPGKVMLVSVNQKPMYTMFDTVEGFKIIGFYPKEEATKARDTALYANTYMYILMFAAMFAMIFALVKRIVVKNLKKVEVNLNEITAGNLDVVVDVRKNKEFNALSNDINQTVSTLKDYIHEAATRMDADLAMAKAIQTSALPAGVGAFPTRKDFAIYARMDTAKEVGGDFYDFYLTHRNELNFLIADVSGKGVPAAMFMMRGKAELKSLTEMGMGVAEVFTKGNSALCEGNDNGLFITGWQGQINLETGLVKFANAGHNPPLVRHDGGDFAYLKSKVNLVLAGMDGVPYKEQGLQLSKGDIIYLYTDGVTEATDANNELYGEDRLLECLNKNKDCTVQEICDRVKEDVDAFVKDAPQFDDITMLCLKYVGKPDHPKIQFDVAKLEDIPVITEWMEAELEKLNCPMKSIIAINIAIDELYSNIVKYAYGFKPGPASVMITPMEDPEGVVVSFMDQGIPYNPIKAEDPDITADAEKRQIGGLGIFMVKKSMDEMSYEYKDEKNILRIRKNF